VNEILQETSWSTSYTTIEMTNPDKKES